MTVVYIVSPYAGDIEQNVARAKRYCREATLQGYLPVAAHLLYPQFLNDDDPSERELGMQLRLHLLALCDEVWCFGPVSKGMAREIKEAEDLCIPIIYKEG